MRLIPCIATVLVLGLLSAPSFAADIQLEPAGSPTPYETAGKAFDLLSYMDRLAISPQQLASMASELDPLATMRTNAAAQESDMLVLAHDALVRKWELLLREQPIPADIETTVDGVLQRIAAQRAGIAQAEERAFTAILASLGPWQILMIEFPAGANMDLAQQSRMAADQLQRARLQGLAAGLLRPAFERVWSLRNQQLYRGQSNAIADELVTSLIQQGLLAPRGYDDYMLVIQDFFLEVRGVGYDQFQAGLASGEIAMEMFDRLGVSASMNLEDLPRIAEEDLREVLLDPACIQMISARSKAILDALLEAQNAR